MKNIDSVDPVDPVVLTQDLVRFESVTPQCGPVLGFLASLLEGLGFRCEMLSFGEGAEKTDNLYARFGTEAPCLCFAGHLDVVPPGPLEAWRFPPFSGHIDTEQGLLYGRGAADMKGAIAAFVAAWTRWRASLATDPGGSVALLLTGDEEGPARFGTRLLVPELYARGERWHACVTGEPTNETFVGQTIKIGRRGSLSLDLCVQGVQGHVGYPHLARNAVHDLVQLCSALVDWRIDEGLEDIFQPSSLQLTRVATSNRARNVIPGSAQASFNIRFNARHTGASLLALVRDRLERAAPAELVWTLESTLSGEAFLTRPNAFTQLVSEACQAVTGTRPVLSTSGGTSDSRFIYPYCPVLDFGLVGATMHQVNECISLESLENLTRIYTNVLENFDFTSRPDASVTPP